MTTRSARTALAAVVFAVLLAQVLLYPGVDTLVTALGADTTLDASMWFLAAEFGAFVCFAGVWGAASDTAGRRVPFIVAGALAGAAGYALLAGLPQVIDLPFLAVLGLRTLQGAATIGAFSLSITMLMDLEGGHGRNMGAAGIAIGGGTALGAPLGGQLYELSPFAPLVAASALLVVVGLLASRVTDRAPAERRGRLGAIRETIRATPAILVPCAFGFVDRLTAGFFALVGTLYFREVFELSPGATGLMLALFFAPFAIFQYPFGVLSDRIGRTIPVLVGSTLYGVVVIGVGLAPTVALAGAAMVAVGVIGALMAPATMALVTDLAADDQRGVAMAAFNAVGSLGFLAGVLVGGTVADQFGFFAAFLTVGGMEVVVATLAVPAFLKLGIPGIATRARES
ncbi:Major Facilitator Superfamily protein [Halorientalis persicus]|uniref:Major Facilitator Superfamily protein n=1 Tax=Halorientalis persicus TaxID=1367881 RepID=A0A1H8D244_9EURY|nr:MFS transporter [Halorientalis persicus]SEN01249.1 Major Facilitator Superfamily protein [Halorientalis persicus]